MPAEQVKSRSKKELLYEVLGHAGLLWIILLLGIVLRILLLLQHRPFFIDEAALTIELLKSDWADVFAPLDYQFAPPFFSILQKVNVFFFGVGEWVLRLTPLAMGIGSLFIFKKWLSKTLTKEIIWFPLALMAMGWEFVKYSVEAKQYSTDVFCAVLLIFLAVQFPWKNKLHSHVFWILAGSLVIWLSMPAVFVLAGVGLYFFMPLITTKDNQSILALFGVGGSWVLSFGLYFLLILGQDIGHSNLQSYHAEYFFPLLPTSVAELKQAGFLLYSFVRTLLGGTFLPLLIGTILLLLGIVHHWKNEKRMCLMLLTPIVLAIVASGIGKYSLISRLTLFFMPFLLFWMGQGIAFLFGLKKRYLNWLLIPLLLICLFTQSSWKYFSKDYEVENMPKLMSFVQENKGANEKVYVYYEGLPTFNFYQSYAAKKSNYQLEDFVIGKYDDRAENVAAQNSGERMWLLCTHISAAQLEYWKNTFGQKRKLIRMKQSNAGAAILFSAVE